MLNCRGVYDDEGCDDESETRAGVKIWRKNEIFAKNVRKTIGHKPKIRPTNKMLNIAVKCRRISNF